MDRMGKKDKAVIRAFTEGRAAEGQKLRTDGERLDGIWMGGNGIAEWKSGKIRFNDLGSRSAAFVQRAVAREAPKNDLVGGGTGWTGGDDPTSSGRRNPKKNPTQYRAIKWRRSSDDTTPVGKWHSARSEALRDAYRDYEPHAPATYEIEDSTGRRKELTDAQMQKAEDWYYESMSARDATGVWGNPRSKNSHDPGKSAREFRAAIDRANENIVESAAAGLRGNTAKMLKHIIAAASWVGRAGAELKYAGPEEIPAGLKADYEQLAAGMRTWGDTTAEYMRDEMGIAANPRHNSADLDPVAEQLLKYLAGQGRAPAGKRVKKPGVMNAAFEQLESKGLIVKAKIGYDVTEAGYTELRRSPNPQRKVR